MIGMEEAAQFLYGEARLADEHQYDAWEALWTDDGIYWVPANGEHTDPDADVSLIYDNRSRMQNRVERYVGGKAYSQQPPPRTAHLVANVAIEPIGVDDGEDRQWAVHSTVQVAESRPGLRVDWVGRVTHHLVERERELRIAFKKVLLVDNDQELTSIDFLL